MSIHFGKYELVSRINIGGMAEIVKARDTSAPDHPVVAVKRILPHLCEDQQYKTMFLDESRVLAQLDHEAIIHTFEIGEVDGTPFIALEFIDGQDARMLFHRSRRDEERVPIGIACYIVAKMCEGLHHAHEQTDAEGSGLGLVHRDVSLQNVLLSYDGDVKITDFGIAMSTENVARTEVGIVKGKFGYMSPEQIKGAPLDRRSDVFAAGICLYELLTSERLFSGDSDYKAVERVRNVDVQPPSSLNRAIPSSLEKIVMKALAKHPRDRYQSANDMRRALLAFMSEIDAGDGKLELGAHLRRVFAGELAGDVRPDGTPPPEGKARPSSAPKPRAELTPTPTQRGGAGSATVQSRPRIDPTPAPLPKRTSTTMPFPALKATPAPAPAAPAPIAPSPSAPVDPLTGLAAFDHLEKPSALNVMPDPEPPPQQAPPPAYASQPAYGAGRSSPPMAAAGRVPPLVPSPESIPGMPAGAFLEQHPRPAAAHVAAPVDMDWDEEEPPTQSRGFDEVPMLDDPRDEDVTRQVRVEDTFPGLRADNSGPFPPTLDPRSRPPVVIESVPAALHEPAPPRGRPRNYLPVIAVVVGIVAVIAAALHTFGSRGTGTILLTTQPPDAEVFVDEQRVAINSSPFTIDQLDPNVEHVIRVSKPGFGQWSSRLRVRPGHVLELPSIALEPQPGLMPQPGAAPAPPPQEAGAPPAVAPAPVPAPKHSRPVTPEPTKPKPAATTTRQKPSPPAQPAAASSSKGTGTLRVNTRPWSRVIIDGKSVGNTPQMNLVLPSGTHKVKFVNPDFGLSKTITVTIKPGKIETQVITLQ